MENADFLLGIDLFRDLPGDLRALVYALFEEVSFEDDAIVFRVSDRSDHVFVVREGAVVLFSDTVGESVELKARIEPGGVFGEVGVLQGSGRTLSARASGPTRLLRLDGRNLLELAGAYEELALRLSKTALRYSFDNRTSRVALARRREARIRLGAKVELRIEGRDPTPAVLENLSLGGACLSGLPATWELAESELLVIGLEPQMGLLRIFARVVWRKCDRLGLAFSQTMSDHELRVAGALHRLTALVLSTSG